MINGNYILHTMKGYRPRIADSLLDSKLESFGATLIVGPKGCGKTTTAKMHSRSFIEFQDEDRREGYLQVAAEQPSRLLKGEKPRLIDEWQDAPKIWGAVRKSVDDEGDNGMYILTGSSSKNVETAHTGTMRISTLEMLPMSLFESGESNGTVSLEKLFAGEPFDGCESDLDMDGLIFAICRGGWPRSLSNPTDRSKLELARDLVYQTCHVDASRIDGVRRDPNLVNRILRSYSRNICTLAETKTILADVNSEGSVTAPTLNSYLEALRMLHLVKDVNAWCPAIRSSSAVRSGVKRNLVDPSIAVATLGVGPEYFDTDFKTLGFLFESLCIRDLKVYSSKMGGEVSYYHDRYGLEADCVLRLRDGRYALIEFKLGSRDIDGGAEHLLRIEELVRRHNAEEKLVPLRLPDLKMVITGTEYGYRREDGVLVIPIGCLRD